MAIEVKIPWGEKYKIHHVVFDLNGTLANDGEIAGSTLERLEALGEQVKIYIITADTHNTAEELKEKIGDFAEVVVLKSDEHDLEKAIFVRSLGYRETITLGNGANDLKMVKEGILSFGVMEGEGMYAPLIGAVDILVHNIDHAMDMLLNPLRIVATIRK